MLMIAFYTEMIVLKAQVFGFHFYETLYVNHKYYSPEVEKAGGGGGGGGGFSSSFLRMMINHYTRLSREF